MKHIIEVENIKCHGCANTITKQLGKLDGVAEVSVDIANGRVHVEAHEDQHDQLVTALQASGYPEKGSKEGIEAAKAKAKSFVSCAIGRIS